MPTALERRLDAFFGNWRPGSLGWSQVDHLDRAVRDILRPADRDLFLTLPLDVVQTRFAPEIAKIRACYQIDQRMLGLALSPMMI